MSVEADRKSPRVAFWPFFRISTPVVNSLLLGVCEFATDIDLQKNGSKFDLPEIFCQPRKVRHNLKLTPLRELVHPLGEDSFLIVTLSFSC